MAAPEDFASFCAAEHSRLVRALSLYCGSREAAEDAAQEALIRACERWGKVAAMRSPAGWVFRVATNHLHSQYRRSRMSARVLANSSRETDVGPDIDQLIVVRQAVAGLPRRQRQALVLRHTFAMTVEETAEVMGVSSPAIRSLTHRAVTTLRTQLRLDGSDDVAEAHDAPDIPNSLDVLLSNAELPPEQAVNVDDLWRRGRRRRGVKVGAVGAVLVAVAVVGVVIATSSTNSSKRVAIAPSPTRAVFQTPNPTLCTSAAAQSRMQAFVAEFNAGDPNIVDESIATTSRLQFVQAPDFVEPTPPTTLRDGLTGYFHQLYAQGDRLKFVSVTAGDIDSFGDRDIAYQLIHITPTGQQQPAGGTASIECYAGTISALYLTW